MKTTIKWTLIAGLILIMYACKEEDLNEHTGTITGGDIVYNKAIDYASVEGGSAVHIESTVGIRLIYVYVVRNLRPDSLILNAFPENGERMYTLTIPFRNFPVSHIDHVTGVRIMAKLKDNRTLEGTVNVQIYDPAAPVLTEFPALISPDISGTEPSSVAGTITSESGLAKVDVYDNSGGDWVLDHSYPLQNGPNDYSLSHMYAYRKPASQLKVTATDIFGQSRSVTIDLDVDLTLLLPQLTDFPELVEPDVEGGPTEITGKISSVAGLKEVRVYDNYQGSFELVETIAGLSGIKDYDFSYQYVYRKKARLLKIEAVDIDDGAAHVEVELYVYSAYNTYTDVQMTAQGTTAQASPNSFFVGQDGSTIGNCEIGGSEARVDFLIYCSSSFQLSFYSPTNTGSVGANYRCEGVSWVPDVPNLKATRFRVLVPGSEAIDAVYQKYNSDTIDELNDELFGDIPVPSSSAVRYDASAAPASNIWNLNTAYLIWVRIPNEDGTFVNGLIHPKEVNIAATAGLSTIRFDIHLPK